MEGVHAYMIPYTTLLPKKVSLRWNEAKIQNTTHSTLVLYSFLTTSPHEECMEIKALSRTYRSTALSSGIADVKLRPKSIRTCQMKV
jgi:hypothetical protein